MKQEAHMGSPEASLKRTEATTGGHAIHQVRAHQSGPEGTAALSSSSEREHKGVADAA